MVVAAVRKRGARSGRLRARLRRLVGLRWRGGGSLTLKLRIASGSVLFAFVTTHLLNHALGNVSVEAMEKGVGFFELAWRNPLGLTLLYTSLTVHAALGFVAFYQRRSFRYTTREVPQLVIGLLIPCVLLIHIVAVRGAYSLHGTHKTYAQELFQFWVSSPTLGVLQTLLVIGVWTHGCLGLYFWLRLKPFFTSGVRSTLLGIAVAIPLLALLGFYQGGRTILEQAKDPKWRSDHVTPIEVGTNDERATLLQIRYIALASYAAIFLLVLGARGFRYFRERSGKIVSVKYPGGINVRVPAGHSVLDVSIMYAIPHAAVCGGKARCGTCRCLVIEGAASLPPPEPAEAAMLERLALQNKTDIRLACQLRPVTDIAVVPIVPVREEASFIVGRQSLRPGNRRNLAILYVEMRGLPALSRPNTNVLDPVFIANQFLDAVVQAVKSSGGLPNRTYGFSLLALFGMNCGIDAAARQALEAAAMIGVNIDQANLVLASGLPSPIEFSIGLDLGEVTVGDVSSEGDLVMAVVGDPVRHAMALADLGSHRNVDVIATEQICSAAGLPSIALESGFIELRGTTRAVRVATRSLAIFGALDALIDVRAHIGETDAMTLASDHLGQA